MTLRITQLRGSMTRPSSSSAYFYAGAIARREPVTFFVSPCLGIGLLELVPANGRQPVLEDDCEVVERFSPFGIGSVHFLDASWIAR
jgi:hypothetical protein